MDTVTSADGTTIAYETVGAGPALVVVPGAFCDRSAFALLGKLLSPDFTVFLYDRRARGDSGDPPPVEVASEVASEVADLAAVLEAAGGSAVVFGHSSGAILSLEAAMHGLPVTALAVYEPPYVVGDDRPPNDRLAAEVAAALAADRPGDAVRAFLEQAVDVPAEVVAGMEHAPVWAHLSALARSLPYDLALAGDQKVPALRLGAITVPTLAISGGDSPRWARNSVAEVSAAIPESRLLSMAGQTHQVSHEALAPVLRDFFATA